MFMHKIKIRLVYTNRSNNFLRPILKRSMIKYLRKVDFASQCHVIYIYLMPHFPYFKFMSDFSKFDLLFMIKHCKVLRLFSCDPFPKKKMENVLFIFIKALEK